MKTRTTAFGLLFSALLFALSLSTYFRPYEASESVQRFSSAAAESAAATAVSQILSEPTFGQDVTKDKIELGDGDLGRHQTAYVQFDPDSGKPYSVNNMTSDAVVPGYGGTPVPAYGAQIIAVGTYGGREALYEIILVRPGITHAAASSGQLILDGHNEAASIKTTEQLAQMTQSGLVDSDSVEDKLRNTTVASGGKTGEPLVLKGDLTLYGDAISGAGIRREGDIKFLHGGVAKVEGLSKLPPVANARPFCPGLHRNWARIFTDISAQFRYNPEQNVLRFARSGNSDSPPTAT